MTHKIHCDMCGAKLHEGKNGRPVCEDCLWMDEGEK